jgi:hypothetical protein
MKRSTKEEEEKTTTTNQSSIVPWEDEAPTASLSFPLPRFFCYLNISEVV